MTERSSGRESGQLVARDGPQGSFAVADLADKRKAALDELTREEIRNAAARVIAAHGMTGMTMSMVAEEAGLAKGTLYNYFEDKNDLIFHVIIGAFEPLVEQIDGLVAADIPPVEQLTQVARAMLSGFADKQQLIDMAVQSRTTVDPAKVMPEMRRLRARMERAFTLIFKRGMELGAFRPGDPTGTARVFLATINGLIHPRVFLAPERDIDEEVAELVDILMNGIASRGSGARK